MAKEGAYQLRLHPDAAEFRDAWAKALDYGTHILADAALDRAIHGVPVPIMHGGEQVGERRTFNERLTMWQLQHRMPDTYGKPGGAGTRARDTIRREEQEEYAREYEERLAVWRSVAQLAAMMYGCGCIAGEARASGDADEADSWDEFYRDMQEFLRGRSTILFIDLILAIHGQQLIDHAHWPKHLALEDTGKDWE
ncbi:MAG: hypothetical protein AAFW97_03445 [Pseudomonadota bacterium]